jgi:uncharacterized protein (DUF924 family)
MKIALDPRMLTGRMDPTAEVLKFWLGPLTSDGRAFPEFSSRWFVKDLSFDLEVFKKFGWLHAVLNAGKRPEWTYSPRGLLAAVIVLDQFSRNMFRDTQGMVAADEQALALALEGISLGYDRKLRIAERVFLYMPLMHAERIDVQNRCVDLFERFVAELGSDAAEEITHNLNFAKGHREVIKRFGRFPHRNEMLERENTAEETLYLNGPDWRFGPLGQPMTEPR